MSGDETQSRVLDLGLSFFDVTEEHLIAKAGEVGDEERAMLVPAGDVGPVRIADVYEVWPQSADRVLGRVSGGLGEGCAEKVGDVELAHGDYHWREGHFSDLQGFRQTTPVPCTPSDPQLTSNHCNEGDAKGSDIQPTCGYCGVQIWVPNRFVLAEKAAVVRHSDEKQKKDGQGNQEQQEHVAQDVRQYSGLGHLHGDEVGMALRGAAAARFGVSLP